MGKLGLWHVGHFGLFPRHFDLIDALIILNHYFLFSKNDERLKQHTIGIEVAKFVRCHRPMIAKMRYVFG